jgi:siroheme synthase (precorrin-2 oxidase/ferrochelatase)
MKRLLIIGFGDIAQRRVPLLAGHCRIHTLASDLCIAHLVAALAKGGSLPQRFVHV